MLSQDNTFADVYSTAHTCLLQLWPVILSALPRKLGYISKLVPMWVHIRGLIVGRLQSWQTN